MLLITILLMIILIIVITLMSFVNIYTFIAHPIKGLMIGVLYNADDDTIDNVKEHTIQIVIWFVCFTFIWETAINK